MCELKPDADAIESFLHQQKEQDWLKRSERRVWPQFVFHYTDIRNANGVLRDGYLYSRLDSRNPLAVSAGSPSVLANTNQEYQDCVRFYFRPRTPTQFYAEGIHSRRSLARSRFPEAHCPVPVFFLFDAASILARSDCQFSDGGLYNPRARLLSTAAELRELPWQKIYHTGAFDWRRTEESDIAFRRNAEVIVAHRVDLSALRYIYCRSVAERETLLHLIGPELRERYRPKTYASTRVELYNRERTFVETVRLRPDGARFQFSPDTVALGPFHSCIEISAGTDRYVQEDESFQLSRRRHVYVVPYGRRLTGYTIRLSLDDHLAYQNVYQETTVPF